MHETVERPEVLHGATHKIKSAAMDHAMYVTINHVILNAGTKHESIRPFEVFINTKDAASQSWIAALTRTISAVWRKGGDFAFILDELKVCMTHARYDSSGGVYVPSVIAHIAMVIEQHLREIGALHKPEHSVEVAQFLDQKREQAKTIGALEHAQTCPKCSAQSLIRMDGCDTCLECGHSKCG